MASRLRSASRRVHAAGIRHDLQFRLGGEVGRQPTEHIEKVGGKARLRIALLLQGEDRHREFGEILEREIVEPAVSGQLDGSVEIVAPESATIADPNRHSG